MFIAAVPSKIGFDTMSIIFMSVAILLFELPILISISLNERSISKSFKNKYCICPNCNAKFKITRFNYYRRFDTKFLVSVECPKCNTRSLRTPLPIYEEEKDKILGPSKRQKRIFVIFTLVIAIFLLATLILCSIAIYQKINSPFYH